MMDSIGREISKELWAEEADEQQRYGKGFHWVESPVVSEYMNLHISGDPAVNWVQYSAAKYLKPRLSPRILSLGCGGGALERDLLRLQPDALIVATDFSPGAIALAQRRAAEANLNIEYRVADMNDMQLGAHAFDFVFASSALHHVDRLEQLLEKIGKWLRPGGMLIANEYVGPNRLQWTAPQVSAINDILALLPDRYRRRVSDPSQYKRVFLGPGPVEQMKAQDPSEAPRSEDIIPLVRQMFHVIEVKPFGGTLLHMLLQDIIGNFRPAEDADNSIIRLICYLEWQLIANGVLKSDFAYFVATPGSVR